MAGQLTNPWHQPNPFLNFSTGGILPQVDQTSGGTLEDLLRDLCTYQVPNRSDKVPLGINLLNRLPSVATTAPWGHCFRILNVEVRGTVKSLISVTNDGQLLQDLSIPWTPIATHPDRTAGGNWARYRFLYFIHKHPGGSSGSDCFSLSVYDREYGTTSWHDTGLEEATLAYRQGQVAQWWQDSTISFPGCPGLGNVPSSYNFYEDYERLYFSARMKPPLPNRWFTLYNVLGWAAQAQRNTLGYPGGLGRFQTDMNTAHGFEALAEIYGLTFLTLHANQGANAFDNAADFAAPDTFLFQYSESIGVNKVFTTQIYSVLVNWPGHLWPVAAHGNWQAALLGRAN